MTQEPQSHAEEFNLSKEIFFTPDPDWDENGNNIPILSVKDVKEFIRLFLEYEDYKIELAKVTEFLTYEEKGVHIRCCIDTKLKIKELAGEQLIK